MMQFNLGSLLSTSARMGSGFSPHLTRTLVIFSFILTTGCGGCLGTPTEFKDITISDEGDSTSTEPSLDFAFITLDGEKGLGESNVALTDADEPEIYRALEGFQTDIRVETYMIPNAQAVTLYVKGQLVGEELVLVDPGSGDLIGSVTFSAITLSHDATGYIVRVETSALDGSAIISESKEIIVDTGTCSVNLLPPNSSCLTQDTDDSSAGYQVSFTVVNAEGDCDQAELDVSVDGGEIKTQNLALDPTGQAIFTVDVSDSPKADGANLSVVARVLDSNNPNRTGVTNPLDYVADNEPPSIQISEPDKELLSLADDLDGDPSNGLQTDVAGTISGQTADSDLTLWLDGTSLGSVTAQADGAFRFSNVTFSHSGSFTLRVTALDDCSNEGEDSRALDVVANQADLTIMSPPNGSTLYAKDDGDLATTDLYEISFNVLALDLLTGYDLIIACTETNDPGVYVTVGSFTVNVISPDDRYDVPTVLNRESLSADQMCRARYLAPTQSSSDDVSLTVALPGPLFVLIQPAESTTTNGTSVDLIAATEHLDGQPATVTLALGAGGPPIIEDVIEDAIDDDVFNHNLLLESGGIPLPDGSYTLKVDVDDMYGNQASLTPGSTTSRTLTIDRTAPVVTITQPSTLLVDPSETADADAITCGFQAVLQFAVNGEAQPDKVVVCLSINGSAPSCKNVTPTNPPEGSVEWTSTLQSGINNVLWTSTDGTGNESTDQVEVVLQDSSPRIIITNPPDGTVTTEENIAVDFSVSSPGAVPLSGATVSLVVNDVNIGGFAIDNGDGTYQYGAVALQVGDNKLQVSAESGGPTGCSAPVIVNYKTDAPTITFTSPIDNDVLNGSSSLCQPVGSNCHTTVSMEATNLEVGSDASLAVCCAPAGQICPSDSAVQYASQMAADGLNFPNVVLSDQTSCLLNASATDLAGQPASAGPISVSIDRKAPTFYGYIQPSGASLTFSNDLDLILDGMQTYISVRAGGVEAGQIISITVSEDGQEFDSIDIPVNVNVSDGGNQVFTSSVVTLKDGTLTLRAEVTDAAGNAASPLNKLVEVLSDSPAIQITLPSYTPLIGCAADADCAAQNGVCEANFCAIKWKNGSSQSLTVVFQGIPQNRPVRICSDGAGVSGGACQTPGFKAVVSGSISGISQTLSLSTADDGLHTFVAEAQVQPEDPWVSSLDAPQPSLRSRRVYLDRVTPSVQNIKCSSDTDEPFDVLNASEKVASGGAFTILVDSDESGGSAEVFANGNSMGSATMNESQAAVAANLPEGAVSVVAVVTDRVGNTSASGAVTYTPVVDTIAPTISFSFPTPGLGIINSTSGPLDVILSSNAIGKSITLYDGGVSLGSVPVEGDGYAVFLHESFGALSEGSHTLTATVSDNANNVGTAETSPTTVAVDTTPPTLQVLVPTSPAAFSQIDDAQPTVGGYQVLVSLTSSDSSTWSIDLANNCDAAYNNCEGAYEAQTGNITNPGGVEPNIFITVPFGTTPYHVMTVYVADDNNNIVSATIQFQINVSSCTGSLVGLNPGGFVNTQSCATPGSDCATANLDLKVVFTGPCDSIDNAELVLVDNNTANTQSLTQSVIGGEASFLVSVSDGDDLTISGQGLNGATPQTETHTGDSNVNVDLSAPVVAFVALPLGSVNTPAEGETVEMGNAHDTNPVAVNLQTNLNASIDDGSGSLTLTSLTIDGNTASLAFPSLPNNYATLPATAILDGVEFVHGEGQVVVLTATDTAGNSSSTSFTANVDLEAPGAVSDVVLDPASVDRRLPSITLNFTAPGEDNSGGEPALNFDVRYSINAITDANFDSACPAVGLGGTSSDIVYNEVTEEYEVSYTIAGPDPTDPGTNPNCHFATSTSATTWNFAVKALDGAGNASSVGVGSTATTSELIFDYLRITGTAGFGPPFDALFNFYGNSVGDLDGDGHGDFTIGGPWVDTFCIVYGRDFATSPPVGGTIDIDDDSEVQCFSGDAGGNLGSKTLNAGDINNDGINDLVVGQGNAAFETEGTLPNREVRIYFGSIINNRPEATAGVIIRGMSNPNTSGMTNFDSVDFNGDGRADLVIGSFNESRAYVVLGRDSWPPASQTIYDLQDPNDLNTLGVITIEVTDATATANFGRNAAGVGDVLSGGGAGNYEEVAISMDRDPAQVIVVPGRETTGAATILISSNGGSTEDDNTVVRLKSHSGANNFGADTLNGDHDLTGDGVPDIIVDHFSGVPFVGIMVYDGAALQGSVGGLHYAGITDPTPVGDNVYRGTAGIAIGGQVLKPVMLPPFDDVAGGSPTWDLAMIRYDPNSGSSGEIYVRLNVSSTEEGWNQGQMPYNSITFTDPDDPATAFFGQSGVFSISDFNGDGFNDLMAPVYGSTPLIIY